MRASRSLAVLLVAFATIAGPGAAPQGGSIPAAAPRPATFSPPLPPGPAPDLDLVFTAQVVGWVEPCG